MNSTIFALTLRQITGQRRILLVGVVAALAPVGLALIYRAGTFDDPLDWTANTLLDNIIVTVVLPLACLLVGTSAMGTEIEDGTAVYLLSKPLPRRESSSPKPRPPSSSPQRSSSPRRRSLPSSRSRAPTARASSRDFWSPLLSESAPTP